MKTVKRTIGTMALAAIVMVTVSCKDGNKNEPAKPMSNEMHQETMDDKTDMAMDNSQDAKAEAILKGYFNLKDALVNDDNSKAKELGNTLAQSLKSFDASSYSDSQQNELKDIIEDATEHAEHIGESDIKHQREHFKTLSKDMTDMVAITGTSMTIYEQYCPMYDNNKGGAWLSMNDEIRNPYFGDKMLTCGKVQREIN
ncbi:MULTISPECIES: DUF3347 domain-containing protein [Maribacter]|jgi:hypothetical protein|uniref:Uncharacterized protein n=2 Tax=Maribacter cobaltidurans TaxID=1178778 RepID=A0A223VAH5_9FLAO|nr:MULTISPECIES: DUF3347 domain-containing protein [Maribacter]MAU70928.1 DUF3347 domain-containing protein [Pseudozobellia sp.]ASV32381.1 hypothetical protein CJ263_20290 [Maribacter cobaltidurans]MBG46965.1 DUF3347 domain-containing protein [Pseudozobellia sp.]MDC6388728.1 DUF3347 domain-containing protein [Maribacter sp. PR1]MEE1976117.1 DUF3347 domain-containing protein [Maribacter cobaltidurans]|tara:strand:- start:435690 stop:436286 length:597 start_codon:yes stop_codon:yes gene_type:complete